MKQGIEKVMEEFDKKELEWFWCKENEEVDEDVKRAVASFLRSAIETALREVRPEWDSNDDAYDYGYNDALEDYDENVKSFLGK